jgi:hypothetical protein
MFIKRDEAVSDMSPLAKAKAEEDAAPRRKPEAESKSKPASAPEPAPAPAAEDNVEAEVASDANPIEEKTEAAEPAAE